MTFDTLDVVFTLIIDNFVNDGMLQAEECLEYFNFSITTLNRYKLKLGIEYPNKFNSSISLEESVNEIFNGQFSVNNRYIIAPLEIDLFSYKHNLTTLNNIFYFCHQFANCTL